MKNLQRREAISNNPLYYKKELLPQTTTFLTADVDYGIKDDNEKNSSCLSFAGKKGMGGHFFNLGGEMKKIILLFVALFILTTALTMANLPGQEEKPRVGVLRFTNHTSAGWWSASVGDELSDMLASELVSTKAFQVLERKEIDAVLGEQDLSESGRVSEATKVQLKKLKGAQYLIAATVSAYEEATKGVGGGVSVGGLSLGGKKEKTYIAVDLKVIDTETGQIVDTRTIEAESKGAGLGGSVSIKGISVQGGGFEKTPAGKAIRACVIYCSEYLECSMVRGKDDSCMKKWDEMEQKRRERTKGVIDIK